MYVVFLIIAREINSQTVQATHTSIYVDQPHLMSVRRFLNQVFSEWKAYIVGI
jgi:hypothetical protein